MAGWAKAIAGNKSRKHIGRYFFIINLMIHEIPGKWKFSGITERRPILRSHAVIGLTNFIHQFPAMAKGRSI
jgi:hypothetical protein